MKTKKIKQNGEHIWHLNLTLHSCVWDLSQKIEKLILFAHILYGKLNIDKAEK